MVVEKEKELQILGVLHDLNIALRIEGYNNIKLEMIRAKENIMGNLKLLNEIKPLPERYRFFNTYKDSEKILFLIGRFNWLQNKVFSDFESTSFLRSEKEAKEVFEKAFLDYKYNFDLLLKFSSISQNLFDLYNLEEKLELEFYSNKNNLDLKKELEEASKTLEEVQTKCRKAEINFFSDFVKINDIRLFETIEKN